MNGRKIQALCVALLGGWAFAVSAGFAAEVTASQAEGAKTQAPAARTVSLPAGVQELRYESGLLTLKAENADLRAVLDAISKASGVEIVVQEGVAGKVSAALPGVALEQAIQTLLRAADSGGYGAEFAKREGESLTLQRITVVRKGGPEGAAQGSQKPPSGQPPRNAKELKEYLKQRYGNEWRVTFTYGAPGFDGIAGTIPGRKPPANETEAMEIAKWFLRDTAFLHGVAPADLRGEYKRHSDDLGYSFEFRQYHQGIPIERARLFVDVGQTAGLTKVTVSNSTLPDVSASASPSPRLARKRSDSGPAST